MKKQPLVTTDELGRKVWLMPDNTHVPYLAGGNGAGDGGEGDGGEGDGGNGGGEGDGGNGGDSEVVKMREALKKANKEAADNRRALKKLQEQAGSVDVEEFNRLKDEQDKREKEGLEAKGQYEKALEKERQKFDTQLKTAQESGEQWKKRYEGLVVDNALLSGAAEGNAINPKAVVTLVRQDYKINVDDEGQVEITDSEGKMPMDDKGNAMSPAQVVTHYLGANQYLVKASDKRGSGSNHQMGKSDNNETLTSQERIARGLKNRK